MIAVGSTATPALAGAGGTAPGTPAPSTPTSKSSIRTHASPTTARTSSLAYHGPVYEKTASCEVVPYTAPLTFGKEASATGGSAASMVGTTKPELLVPGTLARVINGQAAAPMNAPPTVQEIIWAGNQIIGLPYIYGGGHASFTSPGYDCSGTVSYALHGADLLSTPMDSSEFETWGSRGVGQWVTIFANGGHAYMTVAGIRLDTSPVDDPSNQQGPRWRPLRPGNPGFVKRHPTGF
jgi:cell wall-associated NlpC family hydrolase